MLQLIKISPFLSVSILVNSCVSKNKELDAAPENQKKDSAKINTKQKYIGSTDASWKQFYKTFKGQEKIAMLNLMKFVPITAYSGIAVSNIQKVKTGKEIYQYYLKQVWKNSEKSKIISIFYYGESQDFLLGPQDKKWDAALLIEYNSMNDFVKVIKSEVYQKVTGHRIASLEDSRIIPPSNFNIQKLEK
jgi:hypothetical protein